MKPVSTILSSLRYPTMSRDVVEILDERSIVGRDLPDHLIQKAVDSFVSHENLADSVIEKMMLAAMCFMRINDCFPPRIHDVRSGDAWPVAPVVIVPQFVIARYRLDFLVVVKVENNQLWFAVECDGAKFHNSITARKSDNARDCYLDALGIKTIRYGGQWIMKNKGKIADEIEAVINDFIGKSE